MKQLDELTIKEDYPGQNFLNQRVKSSKKFHFPRLLLLRSLVTLIIVSFGVSIGLSRFIILDG